MSFWLYYILKTGERLYYSIIVYHNKNDDVTNFTFYLSLTSFSPNAWRYIPTNELDQDHC